MSLWKNSPHFYPGYTPIKYIKSSPVETQQSSFHCVFFLFHFNKAKIGICVMINVYNKYVIAGHLFVGLTAFDVNVEAHHLVIHVLYNGCR